MLWIICKYYPKAYKSPQTKVSFIMIGHSLSSCVVLLPLIHTYCIVRCNNKYQPFLQMSELPVRRCGTVGSNIADFENFSPDTLKMADICCYGVRYGKCEWGVRAMCERPSAKCNSGAILFVLLRRTMLQCVNRGIHNATTAIVVNSLIR